MARKWKNFDGEQVKVLSTGTPFLQDPRERTCPACGATDVRSYLYQSDRNGQPILIGYSWSTNCLRYDGSTGPLPDGLTFDDPMDDLPPQERTRLRNDLDGLFEYLDDQARRHHGGTASLGAGDMTDEQTNRRVRAALRELDDLER